MPPEPLKVYALRALGRMPSPPGPPPSSEWPAPTNLFEKAACSCRNYTLNFTLVIVCVSSTGTFIRPPISSSKCPTRLILSLAGKFCLPSNRFFLALPWEWTRREFRPFTETNGPVLGEFFANLFTDGFPGDGLAWAASFTSSKAIQDVKMHLAHFGHDLLDRLESSCTKIPYSESRFERWTPLYSCLWVKEKIGIELSVS